MSLPIIFPIKESTHDIKKLMKGSIPFITQRLKLLLVCKEHESDGISKRNLAKALGIDPNSAHRWRKLYREGGIKVLMSYEKKGFKSSVFSEQQKQAMGQKLHETLHPARGFVELQHWMEKEFGREIKYQTLYGYARRVFGAKLKVARKSHVKKDKQAAEDFKKTLVRSVKTYTTKKVNIMKK